MTATRVRLGLSSVARAGAVHEESVAAAVIPRLCSTKTRRLIFVGFMAKVLRSLLGDCRSHSKYRSDSLSHLASRQGTEVFSTRDSGRTHKILQESMIGFSLVRVHAIEKLRDGRFANHAPQPVGS